jgi:hypothetical protein
MSAAALLAELDAAGVRLSLAGDDLHFQTRPGVSIAPYREQITANKPALLAALGGPVVATVPPVGWDGTLPDACGWPHLCGSLGPCPRHLHGGPCRRDGDLCVPRLADLATRLASGARAKR